MKIAQDEYSQRSDFISFFPLAYFYNVFFSMCTCCFIASIQAYTVTQFIPGYKKCTLPARWISLCSQSQRENGHSVSIDGQPFSII